MPITPACLIRIIQHTWASPVSHVGQSRITRGSAPYHTWASPVSHVGQSRITRGSAPYHTWLGWPGAVVTGGRRGSDGVIGQCPGGRQINKAGHKLN